MIRVLFFDGCGTLWYPRTTGREKNPFWIYQDPATREDPDAELVLTPSTLPTLKALRRLKLATVLLSTNPHPPPLANAALLRRVRRLGLQDYLDQCHATPDRHPAKGEFMESILDEMGLKKSEAMMVGDRHVWDYGPARDKGIRALLLESAYEGDTIRGDPSIQTILELEDLLPLLGRS